MQGATTTAAAASWLPHGDVLVAIVTLLLVITTVASIIVAWNLGRRQEMLQTELARQGRDHQKKLDEAQQERRESELKLRGEMSEQQRLFERRSHLIPMWQYIGSLTDINPSEPRTPDVIKAVNTLEFIAICCEAGVVDKAVVMRTFEEKYVDLYRKIKKCGQLPGFDEKKTGQDILDENKSATVLFRELEDEILNRGKLSTIQSGKGSA